MKNKISIYLLFGLVILLQSCIAPKMLSKPENDNMLQPPIAKKIPKDVTVHGDKRIDNYFWLRERENQDIIDYLKAENEYTQAIMKPTEKLQQILFEEMKGRIKETDMSVPVKKDGYFYYYRTEEGEQYSIYCRKKGSLDAEEEVLLDQNQLAEGHDYFELGIIRVSPNHQLLAYAVDTTGGEEFKLYIMDLKNHTLLPDIITNVSYSLEWANDNKTFFYNVLDAAKRPYQVFRHVLGTDPKEDVLIYHEKDDSYFLDVGKSKSEDFLFLVFESNITSEIRYLSASDPFGQFKIVHPRQAGMEYSVSHHGDVFYIVTNDEALNFKLMSAPVSNPSKNNWQEVIPHREKVKIDFIEIFKNHLAVFEKENGLKRIRIIDLNTQKTHYVDFPEPVYTIKGGDNPDFNSNRLRFSYSSLITPKTVYDYHMEDRIREMMKQEEVLGGYDPKQYVTERIWATAPDGTQIPMSIVYRKGMVKDGQNPLLLSGYGAYGYSIEPYFSSRRFSLIDRGFIYVMAHVRGGGFLGRPWYEEGKLLNKKHTFTDFIACAEYLVDEQYTNPDKLVISGGSAGGLLMGAVTNMRPELFKVVVARVPFVDVINTMLDESIPLTVIEFDEWGSPAEKEYYDYIRTYSPYDNVEAQDYPNILVTAGLNDPRVQYWEPAKWVAKMRALKTDDNLLLLKTNMGAGHGGASGRYDYLKEIAFRYAFILDVMEIMVSEH